MLTTTKDFYEVYSLPCHTCVYVSRIRCAGLFFKCKTYESGESDSAYRQIHIKVELTDFPCFSTTPFPCIQTKGPMTITMRDFKDRVDILMRRNYSKSMFSIPSDEIIDGKDYVLTTYLEMLRKDGNAPGTLEIFLPSTVFRKPIVYQVLCSKL